MKIKNLNSGLLVLMITILCSSLQCKKDKTNPPTTLPPITQEGKNTFGCKVDGMVWVPYYKCGGTGNPCGELIVDIRKLFQTPLPVEINIGPGIKYPDNSISSFSILPSNGSGIYLVGNKIDSIILRYTKPGSVEYIEIPGMDFNNNFIITKLDTVNKIIAGIFQATLYRSATDSVKITEGRFDLKFQACRCSN